MPKGVFNWTFHDVSAFLKDYDFHLNHIEGSHYFFIGIYDNQFRQVCVPFHSSKALKPRTLKGVISQSGIPKEKWFN